MDLLALGAAVSLMLTILVSAQAFMSGAAARSQIRGRLEGVIGGTTAVLEGAAIAPLRSNRSMFGAYQFLISGDWLRRMERDLRLADSRLQPVDLIASRLLLAGAGFAVPALFLGGTLGMLIALAAAPIGFMVPKAWLNRRRAARSRKLEEQLPEALTLVANSLRAGFGLLRGISLAGEQLEHPIATELAQTIHETSIGSSTEEAFQALSDRNASYDLDLVVTAILVQRSTGGNLAEILDTVAETMRERVRIRGEINTLTAQQRMTGFVIALLPVAVAGLFFLVSPDYIKPLFTETMGRVMLGAGLAMETLGVLVIRRILDIEV